MSLFLDIEKNYPGFSLCVQMDLPDGVTGLLGASGCGKSQTLRCIAGICRPDRGRIVLDGVTLFDSARGIDLPPQQRGIGYLFQSCALFPHMTVRRNIEAALHAEKSRTKRRQIAQQLMERFRLLPQADLFPRQLSGGQAQRAALARILTCGPRALLLDEPFSAVDAYLREQLQSEFLSFLHSFPGDVILVTHDRDEAYRMAGHLALMDAGHILTHGPTHAVFRSPASICGARLTGCKNIMAARRAGPFSVEVPGWGAVLHTQLAVQPGLTAVGVREHHLSPECPHNRLPVVCAQHIEEPFAWILRLRTAGMGDSQPAIWWRLPKQGPAPAVPAEIGIPPEHILLFYDTEGLP